MFDIINLILLIIVIFILIMLRSVLGRRTGLEKPVIIDFDEHKSKAVETTHEDDVRSPLEINEDSIIKVSEFQIDDIKIEKNIASITCRINAETSSTISEFKDDEKSTKRNSAKIKEIWTFSKNLKSKDPNWKVIAISRLN